MSRLKVSLFGSFGATLDDQVLREFKTDKERGLLAYLAANRDAPQPRTKLAGLLWPETPEARARHNLSQALYSLRLLLGDKKSGDPPSEDNRPGTQPFLLVQADTLQLNASSDTWVDVNAFITLLANSKKHPHQKLYDCGPCLEDLEAATALYRGDFLSGFWLRGSQAFDEWALVQRERLRRLALEGLDTLAACHAARGELELALGHAWRQVEMEPLWEHAQRQLMDLLARSGRRDAAVAQYEACRQVLFDELGMAPEKATTALYEQLRSSPLVPHPPAMQMHNLPAALTPFVGREAELKALKMYLDEPACRLVTLLGPGGSGKTRLALEYARAQIERYPDGAWLVPLAPLRSAEAIPGAIADALGMPPQEGVPAVQQLKDYLRSRQLLLVLDSYEHLLAGANLPVELLNEAPNIKVLATSRQRLNVQGEQLFTLGGLEIPQPGAGLETTRCSEAGQLFVAAGQRARPGFALSEQNLDSVRRISAHVEGMPLGLLLAAAWLDAFSCAEVVAEIERELDFLAAPWEDLPARQRSLRATFDYSWGLLGEQERRALMVLAVFRGGFNGQAASAVAGASPLILRTLVEKSMLDRSLTGRFEMHELLRQYALEKLGARHDDTRAASEAHAAYYLGRLPSWAEAFKGPLQVDNLGEIDHEIGNLEAAWAWATEQRKTAMLDQGLEGLCLYFDLRARLQEGLDACHYPLDRLPTEQSALSDHLRLQINTWNAHFLRRLGQHETAADLLRDNLASLERQADQGQNLQTLRAFMHFELGHAILPIDRQRARLHFQESFDLFENTDDRWQEAQALAGLGLVAHHAGTFAEAVRFYQRSLALYEQLGAPKAIAGVLIELGHNSLRQGHLDQGETYIHRGCGIYEQIGDQACLADNLVQLSRLCFWQGKFADTARLTIKAQPLLDKLGWYENYAFSVAGLGIPLVLLGDYKAAFQQGIAGMAVAQEKNFQRFSAAAYWVQGMAMLGLGDSLAAHDYLQSSESLYRAIDQNDELGWALAAIAYAKLDLEHERSFLESLHEALQLGLDIQGLFPILLALPAAALYHLQQSHTAEKEDADRMILRAVELYALARRYPPAGNAQWFEDVAGKRISAAAAQLPPAAVQAARERGRSQDAFAVAQELLAEFSQSTEPSPIDS